MLNKAVPDCFLLLGVVPKNGIIREFVLNDRDVGSTADFSDFAVFL